MTDDIFEDWKRYHFVVLDPNLGFGTQGVTVLLTDYKFWADHLDELLAWCQQHGAVNQGMTVDMDEKTFLMFALKWEGQKL